MLVVMDYYNVEGFNYSYNPTTNSFEPWNNTYFNQSFSFDVTWKGRMFYLVFAWFLVIESVIGWKEIIDKKPISKKLMTASLTFALIPTVYVLATKFFGLDLAILRYGQSIGIPYLNASNAPSDFLELFWPLSLEYLVFFVFFAFAVMLAYKPKGLKIFSISLALLAGVGIAYMLDTIFPFGVFRPLQEFTLPTAAVAAAIFDYSGYSVILNFPSHVGDSLVPSLMVGSGGYAANVGISWACAGVQSLFLYLLIILLFFKKTNISSFRKLLYFIIGLFGTFFANVARIIMVIFVYMYDGADAGMYFHNTYGELFGFSFIFIFIFFIVCMERFMVVEKVRESSRKVTAQFQGAADKFSSKFKKGETPPSQT
jgi:thaumarchaeosortase